MLDIALARTDHDFTVSSKSGGDAGRRAAKPAASEKEAARKPARRSASTHGALKYLTGRNLAAAALSAVTLGFMVNALAMQKARHPAPLFATTGQVVAPAGPAGAAGVTPEPVPRPAELAMMPAAPPQKPLVERASQPRLPGMDDPIAQLLRPHVAHGKVDAKPEPSKSVMVAQKALVKLGFVLKPDGVFGGTTRQAIERFERDQGMPVRGDLTAKILRQLTAQAGIASQ